jgi:two-component sensor histidine kinase
MVNYFNGKPEKINFQAIEKQNLLLYSRSAGEVSLSGNEYASNAVNYNNTIIIQAYPKKSNS